MGECVGCAIGSGAVHSPRSSSAAAASTRHASAASNSNVAVGARMRAFVPVGSANASCASSAAASNIRIFEDVAMDVAIEMWSRCDLELAFHRI